MDTRTYGGTHLCPDSIQLHHVVARGSSLLVVGERQPEVALLQQRGIHRPPRGHQANVYQVGAPRTAKVGMRKAEDAVAVVVVTTAGVPCNVILRLGTELHHTLRHGCTWEGAAAEGSGGIRLCSYERIHVLSVVGGTCCNERHAYK